MIRFAARVPGFLRRRPVACAALLVAAWLAPWPGARPAGKPLALAPPPAMTATMMERMQ